jgi:hypothetical protein
VISNQATLPTEGTLAHPKAVKQLHAHIFFALDLLMCITPKGPYIFRHSCGTEIFDIRYAVDITT